jgi:hypothetical protein
MVQELAKDYPVTLVNSVNPYRLQGQKTAAFEIVDVMGDAPDWLCIPVGNAGNITAYWMGFSEYHQQGKCRLPQMMGFQAAGAAPLVNGHVVSDPHTLATAIRIGNPASWKQAEAVRDASGGSFTAVTDEEILDAYRISGPGGSFLRTRQCRLRSRIAEGERPSARRRQGGLCADGERPQRILTPPLPTATTRSKGGWCQTRLPWPRPWDFRALGGLYRAPSTLALKP